MAPTKDITFHSSFIPTLKPGKYEITAKQTITHNGSEELPYSSKQQFYVDGPKFELEAGMIHHIYPPSGMEGDFMADVPSIVFNRITLPWERKREGQNVKPDDSWLMLFMVDEEEQKKLTEGKDTAAALFDSSELARNKDAMVNFLSIPDTLSDLFPQENEYQYLSYCRIGAETDEEGSSAHEKAVILGNRLPKPGQINTVYLLSLEHCVAASGQTTYPWLHKWQFFCFDTANYLIPQGSIQAGGAAFPDKLTETLFENSTEFEAALKTLEPAPTTDTIKAYKSNFQFTGGTFHGLLQRLPGKLSRLSYPVSVENAFVRQGGLILNDDAGRIGYRGLLQAAPVPLLFNITEKPQWTGVKKYFSGTSLPASSDCSYQVAHELGLHTALKDEAFHKAFYEWKQEVSAALLSAKKSRNETGRAIDHLPDNSKISADKALPPVVGSKVEAWKKLRGIPYSYLLPSDKMLPRESIRTFCVDRNWVNAFLLGALSIGNTYDSIEQNLLGVYEQNGFFLKTNRFGFMLQSLAVSGWSDYEVDTVLKNAATVLLERKKLAKNIEFFLFEGDENTGGAIQKLTFHLPAGKTHSGFRFEAGQFFKQFRKPGALADTLVPLSFYDDKNRVFRVETLLENANVDLTPSFFGMLLLEGTPKVVFDLNPLGD